MNKSLRKVFWAAGAGWAFDAMDVGLLSFIMVALAKAWNLSPQEAGLLGSINLLGMAIGAVLGGYLADQFGRRSVFIVTLVVFGMASAASALATGLLTMMLFRFIMGLGLGAELPVASTLVSEHSTEATRGRIVVLLESFWAVGWIAAALLAYFIIPNYGWQTAVLIGAIPAVYAGLIRRNIPESPSYMAGSHSIEQGAIQRKQLFTVYKRNTTVLWVLWFAIAFSYYGMFLWLPSVMVAKGFTMVRSFEYVLIMTLAQLPGYFSAAYTIEKWGRKPTLVTYLLGTAVSAVFFGFSTSVTSLLIWGALLSFFNLGAWGALYAYTPENFPARIRATGAGMAAGFGRLGSIVPPYLVGALVTQKVSFGVIFSIFSAVLVIGVVIVAVFGLETKNRELVSNSVGEARR